VSVVFEARTRDGVLQVSFVASDEDIDEWERREPDSWKRSRIYNGQLVTWTRVDFYDHPNQYGGT